MLNENREQRIPKRVALHTLGCRLNLAETDAIRRRLEAAGYHVVPWGQEAELCVLNSCTVTQQSEAKSRRALLGIRRKYPDAQLAVVGCYAQLAGESLAEAGLADLIIGNGEKLKLDEFLPALEGRTKPLVVRPPISRKGFRMDVPAGQTGTTRAHLKVQDGCDFMCSFCIIPSVRGRARARQPDDLMQEAQGLVETGTKELVLTGVNVGTYREAGRSLEQVVDQLDRLPGLARIRISSIEPTTVATGLLERMGDPGHRLVPFLHLPLQSGSGRTLQSMRRRYTPEAYRSFAERALDLVPGLCLGTDVMAGFPAEDAAAFAETVRFLEGLPFAYFHVFPYSSRKGTPAARRLDHVAAGEIKRRTAILRALSDAKRLAYQGRFIGHTLTVLFEQPKRLNLAQGYTENYLRIEVNAPGATALRNRILSVRLTRSGDRGNLATMHGELAEPHGDQGSG